MLVGLLRPDLVVASGRRFRESPIRWVEALAVLQMLGLIATIALAMKARRGFIASLATLLLLVSLLTLWSATRIEGAIFDHEVFWISGIGVLNIGLLVTLAGWLLERRLPARFTSAAVAATLCWALFAICAMLGLSNLRNEVASSSHPSPESEVVATLATELQSYFNRDHIVRPLIRIDQDAWPLAAGVITRLQKKDVPVAVEDDWIPMFTPEFSATGRETVVLAINAKPEHVRSLGKPGDEVVFEHDPLVFVHREGAAVSR